jgi:cytochrome c553
MMKWMKANVGAALAGEDWDGLVKGLEVIQANAPPGFPDWKGDAAAGIAAAKKKDMTALKASCDSCHKTHKAKEKYKDEMRDTPWPK